MQRAEIPADADFSFGVGSQWKEREDGSHICVAVGQYPMDWKGERYFVGQVKPAEENNG